MAISVRSWRTPAFVGIDLVDAGDRRQRSDAVDQVNVSTVVNTVIHNEWSANKPWKSGNFIPSFIRLSGICSMYLGSSCTSERAQFTSTTVSGAE